ncbi:MAG: hypothetical protein H7X92_13145 [Chitinophagales bacterium]|nr:hypothetical protein [Hyphomicrobiales bacterium]
MSCRHILLSLALCVALTAPITAQARECKNMAFSVNDFGKDGPTRDALALLDVHIKKKMDERGVTKYTTGKKTVSCKLYLDLIVFDEYTCTAYANVCWGLGPVTRQSEAAPSPVKLQ